MTQLWDTASEGKVSERRSEVKEEDRVWHGTGDMSEVARPLT